MFEDSVDCARSDSVDVMRPIADVMAEQVDVLFTCLFFLCLVFVISVYMISCDKCSVRSFSVLED